MHISLANLIYIINVRPFPTELDNKIEIFNEGAILSSCYLILCFLDSTLSFEFQDNIAWVLIGVSVGSVVVNLLLVVKTSIISTVEEIKTYYREKQN